MNRSIFSEAEPAPLTPHDRLTQSLIELEQELDCVQYDLRPYHDTNVYGMEGSWLKLDDMLGGPAKNPTGVMCLQRHFHGKTFPLRADKMKPPLAEEPLLERQKVLDLRRERVDDMRATVHTLARFITHARPAPDVSHPIRQFEMSDLQENDIRMVAMLEKLTFGQAGWTREALVALMQHDDWKSHVRDLQVFRDTGVSRFIGHYATSHTEQSLAYTRSTLGTPLTKSVLRVDSVGISAGYRDAGSELLVHRLVQDLIESKLDRLVDGIDEAHP